MKTTVLGALMLLLTSLPLMAATTVRGKVGTESEKVWAFVPPGDGQTTITLTWSKKDTEMFVALDCIVDGELISFGLGASSQERTQHIEAGTFGEACTIAVSSFHGSSPFKLNVDTEAPDELHLRAKALGDPEVAELLDDLRLIPLSSGAIPGLTESIERVRFIRSQQSKGIQKAELENQKIEYGF